MNAVTASRPRCLVVATGLTGALWGAAAVLVRSLATTPRTLDQKPDEALVRLCVAALVVVVAWAWLQAMAGVTDAWRGGTPGHVGAVRRLALVACGAALTGALVSTSAQATTGGPRPDVLAGLPMPERAVGPAHQPADQVVVVRGDSLWELAASELGPQATDREITERWHVVYHRNRAVIGPDPDLISPGQVLRLPHRPEEPS